MEVSFSDRQDMALTGSFSVMDSSTNHFTVIRLPLYSWDANVEGSMGRLLDIGEQGKQDAMSLPSSEREWAPPPSSYRSVIAPYGMPVECFLPIQLPVSCLIESHNDPLAPFLN